MDVLKRTITPNPPPDLILIQASGGNMETLINPRGPSNPTAAAPHWVLLNRKILKDRGSSTAANAKTTAASCTSSGISFGVSFSIAASPETSSFFYNLVAGVGSTPSIDDDKDAKDLHLEIIAAHVDSVLIEARLPMPRHGFRSPVKLEYFLYEAGAGRTPTLSLLPGCYVSKQFQRDKDARQVPTRSVRVRNLSSKDTGILRYGDGEVLAAQLEVGYGTLNGTAELCVLRATSHDWELMALPIVHHEGSGEVQHRPEIEDTVPIGSRYFCWVDYNSGFILCNMVEENPKLRYVPLPLLPAKTDHRSSDSDRPNMQYCRNLAAAGPSAVRFVSVAPRCCCGGPGKTFCERSKTAFNVTTWTLTLRTEEPMAWVKDGVVDCDELWQLPNYGCLPRVVLHWPIVSSGDPDVVYFRVCENNYYMNTADKSVWMVVINTRRKVLLSVIVSGSKYYSPGDLLCAKLHWL